MKTVFWATFIVFITKLQTAATHLQQYEELKLLDQKCRQLNSICNLLILKNRKLGINLYRYKTRITGIVLQIKALCSFGLLLSILWNKVNTEILYYYYYLNCNIPLPPNEYRLLLSIQSTKIFTM